MLADSGRPGEILLADAAIEPERVADALGQALAGGHFLVLPHPEVRDYYAARADRYRQVAARHEPPAAESREGSHEGVAGTTHGEPGGRAELAEAPLPQAGPGQLLVRVLAAAANFPDVLMVPGTYQVRPPLPFTPGVELCGEVVAGRPGGDRLRVGDRVIGGVALPHGAFAEYALMNAARVLPAPGRA